MYTMHYVTDGFAMCSTG